MMLPFLPARIVTVISTNITPGWIGIGCGHFDILEECSCRSSANELVHGLQIRIDIADHLAILHVQLETPEFDQSSIL